VLVYILSYLTPGVTGRQAPFLADPMHALVYARHGREPFGPELKADGLMGCPAFAGSYGEAGSPLYMNPVNE